MKARYPGKCAVCGGRFPAGAEIVFAKSAPRGKKTSHAGCVATPEGAPGHGPGCYGECDGLFDCGAPAESYYGSAAEAASGVGGGGSEVYEVRTSGGTFYRNARGLCEDAPCCGCCTF